MTDEVELRDPKLRQHRSTFILPDQPRDSRRDIDHLCGSNLAEDRDSHLFRSAGLKHDKADELQTFIADHLGLEIRLIDHEDRLWRGVITQPQNPKVEDSSGRFTMSFEFQGSKV